MRESNEKGARVAIPGKLGKYCSISRKVAGVKSLTNEHYNLQITKARILKEEGYRLIRGSYQLSMLVGISEAIRLLSTHNKGERGGNKG